MLYSSLKSINIIFGSQGLCELAQGLENQILMNITMISILEEITRSWPQNSSPHCWCLKKTILQYNVLYEGRYALYVYLFLGPLNRCAFLKDSPSIGCQDHDSACTYHSLYPIISPFLTFVNIPFTYVM